MAIASRSTKRSVPTVNMGMDKEGEPSTTMGNGIALANSKIAMMQFSAHEADFIHWMLNFAASVVDRLVNRARENSIMCFWRRVMPVFLRVIPVFLVAVGAVGFSSPSAVAGSEDKPPRQSLCGIYENIYEGANKEMALISGEGTFDNSAPRETNRQLKILNERVLQLIVISQMQAHGCAIPKIPSDGDIGYTIHAIECHTERMKGNFNSSKCDKSSWKRIKNIE